VIQKVEAEPSFGWVHQLKEGEHREQEDVLNGRRASVASKKLYSQQSSEGVSGACTSFCLIEEG
jgi:hypothetical protein